MQDRVGMLAMGLKRLCRWGVRTGISVMLGLQPVVVSAQDLGGSSPGGGSSSLGAGLPPSLNGSAVQQLLQSGQAPQLLQQAQQAQQAQQTFQQQQADSALSPDQGLPNQQMTPGGQIELPPSAIDSSFSLRAGATLRQFGYNVFGIGRPVVAGQSGAIADSYVLGPDDEIVVNLRGQQQGAYRMNVDREGRVVLPGLPPVMAAGRTFGDFRRDLQAVVGNTFVGTEVFVSLGQVRQLSVLILGEVNRPGMIRPSALSTVVDALLLAGGVKQTGSLRNIHLYRGGQELPVDLYTLLSDQGTKITLSIQDGDRILVPPIGDLVAATGEVRRPGIFELAPGQKSISADDLVKLAGGLPRGAYRYALQRIERNGAENFVPLRGLDGVSLAGGEILFARPQRNVVSGKVQLLGNVRLPGDYPLSRYGTLRDLVGHTEALGPAPYLPYAVLETTDPRTLARKFRSFDLGQVVAGRSNARLIDGDRIFVFGADDIGFLSSDRVLDALRGSASQSGLPSGVIGMPGVGGVVPGADQSGVAAAPGSMSTQGVVLSSQGSALSAAASAGSGCSGATLLALRIHNNPTGELATGQLAEAARNMVGLRQPCPQLFDQVPELLTFMVLQSVFVAGDAQRPGIYPVVDRAHARAVLSIAGAPPGAPRGTAAEAVSSDRAVLQARRARVTLAGALNFPGSHDLASAPTLKSLLGDRSIYAERPYLLFGIIARQTRDTMARVLVPFSPFNVIDGREDLALQDRDLVIVFSQDDMRDLVARVESDHDRQLRDEPLAPALGAAQSDISPEQLLRSAVSASGAVPLDQQSVIAQTDTTSQAQDRARSEAVLRSVGNLSPVASPWAGAIQQRGSSGAEGKAEALPLDYDILAPLIVDHIATISGSVNQPGDYPVMPQTSLGELIAVAGGLRAEADLSAVELSTTVLLPTEARSVTERNRFDLRDGNYERVLVSPRNVVFIRQLSGNRENGAVALLGEVRHPGQYDLLRSETLTSVLQRAGGLNEVAYPFGAVFSRVSAAHAERDALRRMADQIEQGLSTVALTPSQDKNQQVQPQDLEFLRQTLDHLRSAPVLGRIAVEANPAVLAVHPELDTLMQAGDAIYYPKRPSTIVVSGEVLVPGSQQFLSGVDAASYIKAAGGTTQSADTSRSFVLLPNGTAQPLHLAAWDFRTNKVPPGSAIIVPRDLKPFSAWTFATNLTQVLSQVAVTAASLAVVSRR